MKRKCNENEENDHQREHALIFYQILSTNSVRKFMETSLENLYVDIGAKMINRNLSNMQLQIGFCCSNL